jgi:hypothetical protein
MAMRWFGGKGLAENVMFQTNIYSPQFRQWQSRLARVPRWGWIAIFIGIVLPLVVLGLGLVAVAVISGLIVFAAVAVIATLVAVVRKLMHRPVDDGRRNVIVVRSVRVIDP